jgi:ribosomal protein L15
MPLYRRLPKRGCNFKSRNNTITYW